MDKKENVISILVNNKPDVLARVAGTLGGKGYNIETLCVDVTINPDVSKIILTTIGTKATVQKIEAQLTRLIDVIKVENLTDVETVKRELVLIRIATEGAARSQLLELANVFRARIVDVAPRATTIEITGSTDKMEAFLDLVRPFGIKEMVRTGKIALGRAPREKKQ